MTELKRSLSATALTAPGAAERFRAAADEYDKIVAEARRSAEHARRVKEQGFDELTPELAEYLIQAYKSELLADDDEVRWSPMSPERRLQRMERLRQNTVEELQEHRALRALGDLDAIVSGWTSSVLDFAECRELLLDDATDAFRDLCRAFNDANIHVWEATLQRLDGESVPTPPEPPRPEGRTQRALGAAKSGRSFEEIAEGILTSDRQPVGASTLQASRTALRLFREAFGPRRPEEIKKAIVSEWLDLLAKRPAKLPPGDRDRHLRELVERYAERDVPRLTPKTMAQHLGMMSSLWTKAQREEGYIAEGLQNPFVARKSLAVSKPETPQELSLDEMHAIFALPIFTRGERPTQGKGEASYWLPLLLLWTGARPEELAQLMVSDVSQGEDGRWVLRITDEGDHPHKGSRNLKTSKHGTGRRTFPIPKALLDLNFLAYVQWVKRSEETALFPKLRVKGERGLLFAGFSEWWSKYLKASGVALEGEGRRPSREFRHNWATAARRSKIPRDAREYIMGHRLSDASAGEGYGDRESLGDFIDQLEFKGLDLTGVKPWSCS